MTTQYRSDEKRGYEAWLKQYDADKSGVSDWTEYLTGLQQSVKDTSTAYQKSAYNDISQAYRNYFIQSSNLAGKGLASGLKQDLSSQLYSSYQNTKAGVEESAANKITSLLENYSKTVSEGEKKLSEQAGNLTKVTEAALDWYEQVGSSKKILDDKMKETDQYRYQDLIDLYKENKGELWQKSSDDISSPYVLSGLGQAIVDTAFADEDFANYLKDYDSKLDLRDVFLDNKDALYEALNVGAHSEKQNAISKALSNVDDNVKNSINTVKLTYSDADDIDDIVKNISEHYVDTSHSSSRNFMDDIAKGVVRGASVIKNIPNILGTTVDVLFNGNNVKPVDKTDAIYDKYLQYVKPEKTGIYVDKKKDGSGVYYWYNNGSWYKRDIKQSEQSEQSKKEIKKQNDTAY